MSMEGIRNELAQRLKHVSGHGFEPLRLPEPVTSESPYLIGVIADPHPLIRRDEALARFGLADILYGLGTLALVAQSKRVVLAIGEEYSQIIQLAQGMCKERLIDIVALPTRYPRDMQSISVDVADALKRPYELFHRTKIYSAQVLYDVALALKNKPATTRWVSIVGAVKRPQCFPVPIGASIDDLVRLSKPTLKTYALYGGVLPQIKPIETDAAVDLQTQAIWVLPLAHDVQHAQSVPPRDRLKQAASACTQCKQCRDICPLYLNTQSFDPSELIATLKHGQTHILSAMHCVECGYCNLQCPAGIKPATLITELKAGLKNEDVMLIEPLLLNPHPQRALRRYSAERLSQNIADLMPIKPEIVNQSPTLSELTIPWHHPSERWSYVSKGDEINAGHPLMRGTSDCVDLFSPWSGVVSSIDPSDGISLRR